MKNINTFLKEINPEDIRYEKLKNLIDYVQPTKFIVKDTKYKNEYKIPVLTAGKSFILGYTNEKEGIYNASKEQPVMIFDDFTTSMHWVDFDFKIKSSAMKILVNKTEENNFRFLYHSMKIIDYKIAKENHERHWISKYSQIEIALPPLEIQNKIVSILDEFSRLEAELEAELEARNKQYNYYLNYLMNFDDKENKKVEWYKLEEIVTIKPGSRITKAMMNDSFQYPVMGGGVKATGYYNDWNFENVVTVIKYGAAGHVNWIGEKFWAMDVCFVLLPKNNSLLDKFLYYYLKSKQQELINLKRTTAFPPALERNALATFLVPIPSFEEQNRIVNILDKFSKLTSDINEGLPAEIKMRRQQYEYYREKLLTFSQS
ncbi:restriction endonuclease subunit S [Mycoplasmopsis agassizii]|uniref:Restriction endonuclease subunit S n=1 Tax=Mycoplasmopsis agassizii TaxID=33922 RepID=A0ABX4H5U5_9BACT|nr:restriction endonuclease subunit S [Mycoplasmopsis agassizii]PAF55264.1 restriction endonuclease subunit S [Mycoplasmopsis agassizii]SMC15682.1 type I restriction enzyme, S subunit [Mycoplasmopsis agassizii]